MAKGKKQRKMRTRMTRPADPRYAANPLDYKKVILDRNKNVEMSIIPKLKFGSNHQMSTSLSLNAFNKCGQCFATLAYTYRPHERPLSFDSV